MTPHNEAKKNDIAKTVIMPGDPMRAKVIADTYLENVRLVNKVRNIYAFTGTYKGKELTVMASGMGMPSIGIYSYELFTEYDVDNIIRVGSAGAYTADLKLYDVILAEQSYSESTYAKTQNGDCHTILAGSSKLNDIIKITANNLNQNIIVGTLHSTDVFYKKDNNFKELYEQYNCLACEMESFALFHNAHVCGKNAACLVTISDNLVTHEETTSEERQNSFNKMIELALESSLYI